MIKLKLCFLTILTISLNAQNCIPVGSLPDSVWISPEPYDPVHSPNGGIDQEACLNESFAFTFSINVPSIYASPIGDVPVDSLAIENVLGMPNGFAYACEPPSCGFQTNAIGCLKIFGTATDPNDSNSSFEISFEAKLHSVIDFDLTIPDPDDFPGEYTLIVNPENDPNCSPTSIADISSETNMSILPNPIIDNAKILISSESKSSLKLMNSIGELVYEIENISGGNQLDFDASKFSPGLYILSLSNGVETISKKIIIGRN